MTPTEIAAAIVNDQAIRDLYPDTAAIAAALSVGRTKVVRGMISARGLAERYPNGPIALEAVLLKLEGFVATAAALEQNEANTQTKLIGSLLKRQLGFLNADGLDFGSPALRQMLDQFAALNIITTDEAAALKAVAEVADPITQREVDVAIFSAEGILLI